MSDLLEREAQSFDLVASDYGELRLRAFETLVAEMERAAAGTTGEEFSRLFDHAQKILGLSDLELSRLLKVSRPTIGRWTRGDTSPHAVMARAVFDVLSTTAKKELRRLRHLG
jgi:ribosome-binding protein aMBF1 (putative translation factor)